uniref:Uncharacterized protein n=1 Tax=Anser cygnoides TaxID=8845 RepID=A0A8B9DCW4_ANSCY
MTTKANFPAAAGSVVVPYGHAVGNEKWRGSEIAQRLQGKHKQLGRKNKKLRQSSPSVAQCCWIGWDMLYSQTGAVFVK